MHPQKMSVWEMVRSAKGVKASADDACARLGRPVPFMATRKIPAEEARAKAVM